MIVGRVDGTKLYIECLKRDGTSKQCSFALFRQVLLSVDKIRCGAKKIPWHLAKKCFSFIDTAAFYVLQCP